MTGPITEFLQDYLNKKLQFQTNLLDLSRTTPTLHDIILLNNVLNPKSEETTESASVLNIETGEVRTGIFVPDSVSGAHQLIKIIPEDESYLSEWRPI